MLNPDLIGVPPRNVFLSVYSISSFVTSFRHSIESSRCFNYLTRILLLFSSVETFRFMLLLSRLVCLIKKEQSEISVFSFSTIVRDERLKILISAFDFELTLILS